VEHALENAAAAGLELSDDDLRRIDRAFPRGRRRRGVPMI
jgi:diketogulonate reductase-like aldo/keto reductase